MFENDVKMYGTQTICGSSPLHAQFENDVKMYGTQTQEENKIFYVEFENDVKFIFVNNKNR